MAKNDELTTARPAHEPRSPYRCSLGTVRASREDENQVKFTGGAKHILITFPGVSDKRLLLDASINNPETPKVCFKG